MAVSLVGAIDIGTSFSGWAFSFTHQAERIITKHWNGENIEKTRTCLLVSPDKQTVIAFGNEAENKFVELATEGVQEDYYYFKEFKNVLKPGKKINRDLMIRDEMGKSLKAIDVFSMTMQHLIDDMIGVVNQTLMKQPDNENRSVLKTVDKTNVFWVITVPTIWTQAGRRFMRESAIQAGLDSHNIILALEPEVASIYCQTMSVHDTLDKKLVQFPIGTRYVVLDAGGGTVDLSIHEVEDDLAVKEVATAHGEGWGGTLVNETIENYLINIFGEEIYAEFKENNIHDWMELMREIENGKKKVHPTREFKMCLNIPKSLKQMLEEKHRKTLAEYVHKINYSRKILVRGTQFQFTAEFSRSFFNEAISKILKLIENQIESVRRGKPKTIVLVGGFSDSPVVQNAVKTAFPNMVVAVSKYSPSVVLRGAVRYGHHPMSITERVLKYTYGVEVMRKFKHGQHPEDKRIQTDKGDHCKHVFSKHVEKQEVVRVGESQVEQRYTPSHNDKKTACLKLFISRDKNPRYTDEESCSCIGEVTFDLADHDGDLSRGLWVSYTFSGPEIRVDVYDEKSGKTIEAKTWFLGPSMN